MGSKYTSQENEYHQTRFQRMCTIKKLVSLILYVCAEQYMIIASYIHWGSKGTVSPLDFGGCTFFSYCVAPLDFGCCTFFSYCVAPLGIQATTQIRTQSHNAPKYPIVAPLLQILFLPPPLINILS